MIILRARILLFSLMLTVFTTGKNAIAGGSVAMPNPSRSVAEAKQRKSYVRDIEVSPKAFVWKGHEYKVHECWEERPPLNAKKTFKFFTGIAFTLEVDGQYPSRQSASIPFTNDNACCGDKYPIHSIIGTPSPGSIELLVADHYGKTQPIERPKLTFLVPPENNH